MCVWRFNATSAHGGALYVAAVLTHSSQRHTPRLLSNLGQDSHLRNLTISLAFSPKPDISEIFM